ncbi:MAG: ABC transporter ATP-binding protein [Candidatus Paceibacterota bacterium]|jgi:ATP-binding cassette subfamily B protein
MDYNKMEWKLTGLQSLWKNAVRILKICFEDQGRLLITIISLTLVVSALPFLKQGAYALLVDVIAVPNSGKLTYVLGLVVLLLVLPEFIYSLKGYFDKRFYIDIQKIFELRYLKHKAKIDVARYEDSNFNNLLNNAAERGMWPIVNLADGLIANISNIIGVIVAGIILIFYNWVFFLLIFVALIPKLYVEIKYSRDVWGIFNASAHDRRRYWDLRGHFYDVPKLTELKLFQNVSEFSKRINKILADFSSDQKANEWRKTRLTLFALILSGLAYLFFGFTVANSAFSGQISPGTMIFVIGSVIEFGNALSGFFLNVGKRYEENLFVTDIFSIMETQPIITPPQNPTLVDYTIAPRVEFKNVSFKYPKSESLILKDISFTIEPGEKLALVGINGSGKTTLIKLLCRFYDPVAGQILVNGVDLKEIDLDSWWKHLGVLFQDFASYNFLAREVIALGRSQVEAKHEHISRAAQMAEADEFIMRWKKGYEQMLGKEFEEGIDPSKGQIQKLALARVFFRDPKIMVLDEPTASVDAESEAKIFERFTALPDSVSAILISHRFSTVKKTDKIIVLKDKKIAEIGSHKTLIAQNGIYAGLFRLQAKGYKE